MSKYPPAKPYTLATTWEHVRASPEIPLVGAAAIAWYAYKDFDWSSSPRFTILREGWFGQNTYAGGVDKIGHSFTTYILADFLAWGFRQKGFDPYGSAISGAVISWLVMGAYEITDGFNKAYGFAVEDITFNTLGAVFSFLRNTVPGMREKLDFRVQWTPQIYDWLDSARLLPVSDYSSKKFLFALKLAGFEDIRDTPLRFVELHAGYFTRGYSDPELAIGVPKERHLFAGIGLNLNEVFFPDPAMRQTWPAAITSTALEYVQVPYTSVTTSNRR